MKRLTFIFIILTLVASSSAASAQRITDAGYRTIAHIKSDGTIQDSGYHTIGHASGIPPKWAAYFIFFR